MKRFIYILAGMMALCSSLAGCTQAPPDHTGLIEDVRSAEKMVFAQMAVTKTAKTSRTAWYKIGDRIAVYSYDTYLRGYIDLSELQPEDFVFDDAAKTVKIYLPPVQTELEGRDMTLRQEYEHVDPLRSKIDSRERALLKEKANQSLRAELAHNPMYRNTLTKNAERKARAYFENFFADQGYTASVEFKQQ